MEKRAALPAVIDHGRKLGDELAGRLTADERARNGTYETWAPKDVFAHVAEWLARDLQRLEITDGQGETTRRLVPTISVDPDLISTERIVIFVQFSIARLPMNTRVHISSFSIYAILLFRR